jgi:diguanylate cyclase (GGDEF)-like protein
VPDRDITWRILFSTIILLLVGSSVGSRAADLPLLSVDNATPQIELGPHAEYLLDPSDRYRYEDVIRGDIPFQRHKGNSFQFSFKRTTLWIKCRVAVKKENPPGEGGSLRSFLSFDNATLGAVTVWVPVLHDGRPDVVELKGGWRQSRESHEFPFLHPTFMLPLNIDTSRPLVIRVVTPYSLQFRATLQTVAAFRQNSFTIVLIGGFFAGVLVAMILYNLVLYLFVRDRHYLYYIIYVFFLLIWQVTLLGIFRYFWGPLGDWMISHIVVLATAMMFFAILFAIVFLNTATTAPRHDLLLKGVAALMVFIMLLSLFRQLWVANVLAYLNGQIATVLLLTSAVSSLRFGFKSALYYLIAVSTLLLAATIFLLKFYGLIPNNPFTMHIMLFGTAAEGILLSFALAHRIRVMREEEQAMLERERFLQAISVTDELTGLFNRRFLNATLAKKIAEANRMHTNLCVLMIDVDHFKLFNDTYGHLEGDKVLKALSELMAKVLREDDIACRYGGEEFAVILSNTDMNGAMDVAQRIRSNFETINFRCGAKRNVSVTVSIGVAQYVPTDDPDSLLRRADEALYQAKQTGRNRVCHAA